MMGSFFGKLIGGISESAGHGVQNIGSSGDSILNYMGQKKQLKDYHSGLDKVEGINQETLDQLNAMYDPYTQAGQQALSELQTGDFEYDMPEFDQSSARNWLDPSMDFQMDQANKALSSRQAGTGDYLSGAGMQALGEQNRQMAETGYGKAQGMAYQDYMNRVQSDRQNIADRYNRLQNMNQMGYGATGAQAGARQNFGDQMAGTAVNRAELNAQRSMMPYQLAGTLLQNQTTNMAQDLQTGGNLFGSQGSFDSSAYAKPSQQGGFTPMQGGGQVSSSNIGQTSSAPNMNLSELDVDLMGQTEGFSNIGGAF